MTPAQRERAATCLVEVLAQVGVSPTQADLNVARARKVSVRSLRRWRRQMDADPELAALVLEKKARVEQGWADEVPGALRAAVTFLRESAEQGDRKNPDAVRAISQAMKDLSEVASLWKMLDVRLARSTGANAAAARPVAAGASWAGPRGAQPN